MRKPRALRLARATTAASIATFTALVSHVIAGGAMPGWPGVLVPWALSFVACLALSGVRRSLPRLIAAVASSQLLFHTLFVIGAAPAEGAGGVVSSASHHGSITVASPDPAAATIHADGAMWIWHGVAALLTIAALYRGEQAIAHLHLVARGLVSWVRRLLGGSLAMPRSAVRVPGRVEPSTSPDAAPEPFLVSVGRRGPPLPQLT